MKIKPGDKVRLTGTSWPPEMSGPLHWGSIQEVESVAEDGDLQFAGCYGGHWFVECESFKVELIEEQKMTENYVGALVEVEIDPEYTVRLRVAKQDRDWLSSSTPRTVGTEGRKVTVIEPAPIPEPLNGEVWRSSSDPSYTFTWDDLNAVWRSSLSSHAYTAHPLKMGYIKIAEGVA